MTPEEYKQWLETVAIEDQIAHQSNRRTIDNHQWQAEQVIGNLAALDEIRSGDALARDILGNPQ